MLFETDTTTKEVLTMYAVWFSFIAVLLVVAFKSRRK
jgi:hypothetical protein